MAYVAGPVLREGIPADPWVEECYRIIEQAAGKVRQSAAIPRAEMLLEKASPKDFAAKILSRIRDAGSVVAVFLPNDPSTPIECAFAVREGKRVLIIHQPGVRVPRLLSGLNGVETIEFESLAERDLLSDIREFLGRK